jgi:hypothetical protein
MTAARRLAAILAADVVGYSMLISGKEVGRQFAHSARAHLVRDMPKLAFIGKLEIAPGHLDRVFLQFHARFSPWRCRLFFEQISH